MIASRLALDQMIARSGTVTTVIRRMKSTPVSGVVVEHGRGEWKTYGDLSNYKQGKYQIKTFNKISPIGLARFPSDEYDLRTGSEEAANAHAILLRSHKLQEDDVPKTVRAIAR
jgi:D-3-phosphoglycerate dehydrogenase